MSTIPPAAPQPHDPANPPPPAGAEEFALKVQEFWAKNRSFIFLMIAAVVLVLVGREGWQYYQAAQERSIQQAYAKIDRVEQLPKFAEENKGHPLAGVAWLRVADEAYGKNDFKGALANYQKATEALSSNAALKARARLGAAMSQVAAGDRAAAETGLKALSGDKDAPATLRAEAAFHLAILAREAGRKDEAKQYLDEVSKLEATGLWAQRAFGLRAQLEQEQPSKPANSDAPTVQFKPGGK